MVINTINTLTERNKELLTKIEELENKDKTEITREAQLKIIDKIETWKKENIEVGTRLKEWLKKYGGHLNEETRNIEYIYPSHIMNNLTEDWPLWKYLACNANSELRMAQYLDREENPLDALLEMMLNSILVNKAKLLKFEGLKQKQDKEHQELREELKEVKKEKENYYKELTDKKIEIDRLEEELKELTVFKERFENLKEKTVELLSIWHKEQEEIDDISWDDQIHNWDLGELKELKGRVGEDLNEVIFTVIEKLDQTSKDLIEAINTAEAWKNWQKGLLNEEIKAQALMLKESDKMLEEERVKNTKLQEESEEKSKMLAESEEREEELNRQLHLERKPLPALPALPKKRNTFQKLGSRIKTKFQKFQQLVENKKHQSQEFTARIEVKVN